jgi:hypothetical protein
VRSHRRLQAQIGAKHQAAEQVRQREREQDAAARHRAAQYEANMTAHLLQAQPALTQNYGHKKSQLF